MTEQATRRQFLKQSAVLGGAFAADLGLPRSSNAQDKTIVVTSYGGNWEKAIKQHVVPCFEKATGGRANVLVGQESDWIAKIDAERERPPIHVLVSSAEYAGRIKSMGIAEKITAARVPNLRDVPPLFFDPQRDLGPAFDYGAAVICYNAEKIAEPPASVAEFVERAGKGEYGRKVTIPGITYPWTASVAIWNFADVFGGSVEKPDTGFEAIRRLKPHIPKFYTTGPELLNLFRQGEVNIAIFWNGVFQAFIDGGARFARWVNPKEGGIMGVVVVHKVKNAPDIAWDYVNCMLDPAVGAGFASVLVGYGLTNQKVKYPAAVADKIILPKDLRKPPFDAIQAALPAWTDRWNREIGA